ncbi:hypothetical protein OGAPHI_004479 [Ogataea philodendri]|uniref:CDP-diacylglycerol--glycerol-3-phosphate 1-phosphatidyltransferase n=1 Tax=Ogataea philodendri TaxID=1378263 RepID=A0A9P8T5P2_9ASCO|nr:uncharacterized protein OGAPHI_004479 [Ogataea philodendri]KAH3666290.1 hypothetical protein OGAPHI_004479 [Ogataea philodendri]
MFWSIHRCLQCVILSTRVENPRVSNFDAFHPTLRATMNQLDTISPRFELAKDQLHILYSPADFYSLLKAKIRSAESRIFLSSLYIGKAQHELVQCLQSSLSQKPDLRVEILMDCLRSTREAPGASPASLLSPLVEQFGKERVNVRLYHTPQLSGLKKMLLPKRINEGWGLQHMKICGFDQEVILTGANLSEDYFTNRQDRYYLFKSGPLSDYYHNIQKAVSSFSYQLLPAQNKQKFLLDWPSTNVTTDPHINARQFIQDSSVLMSSLLKQTSSQANVLSDPEILVYPVSSFKPVMEVDESTERPAILHLLQQLDDPAVNWTFTAGYFNCHPEIKERFIKSHAKGTVITAAPEANSFYKSKGISQYLPDAYLYKAQLFLQQVQRKDTVKLLEWQNGIVNTPNGWSYHAKGLWLSLPNEVEPSITIVGSSNYTRRAYSLDLETNAVVITKNQQVKQEMLKEVENLTSHTTQLTDLSHRQISPGVKLATTILSQMFQHLQNLLGCFPVNTSVCNGATVFQFVFSSFLKRWHVLSSLANITLNHQTTNTSVPVLELSGDLGGNLWLVAVVFVGISVRAVDHDTAFTLLKNTSLGEGSFGLTNTLFVEVGTFLTSTQNHEGVGVSLGTNDGNHTWLGNRKEVVRMCGSTHGIDSNAQRTVGTVLETDWEGQSGRKLSVQLRFGGTGANSTNREQIAKELWRNGVQHFTGNRKLLSQLDEQLSGDSQTLVDVEGSIDIWIVDQSFPTNSGTRLLKVSSHDNVQVSLDLFSEAGQTVTVVQSSSRVVDRTWSNHNQQSVVFATQDIAGIFSAFQNVFLRFGAQWELVLKKIWRSQRVVTSNSPVLQTRSVAHMGVFHEHFAVGSSWRLVC